jgi:hypothetical protein
VEASGSTCLKTGASPRILEQSMRKFSWSKIARSWWGRIIMGAFIGGVLMAWVSIQDPSLIFVGMVIGAAALFFLGRLT